MMRASAKIGVVFLATLLPSIGVLRNARMRAPVKDGTAREFWMFACGVDVADSGEEQRLFGGIYPPKGEWAIYYIQGWHNQFLFRVRLSEIAQFTPEVIDRLEARKQKGDLNPVIQRVVESGIKHDAKPPDARKLLELIWSTKLDMALKADSDRHAYLLESERLFDERWRRAQVYWLTLAFESVWLGGLVAFAAIPWICCSNRFRWAIHLGLTPTLLFLPHFLGYVPYTFTSAFPGGGVFYPDVLIWFRGLPWTSLDTWLLQSAPQLFEPLTQRPGPMIAVTGMGGVGPVATCVIGVAIGIVTFGAGSAWRWIRSWPVQRKKQAER